MLYRNRREFITLLGGVAAWPLPLSAQQSVPFADWRIRPGMPVIGVLDEVSAVEWGFRHGLSEMGFVEGRNLAIDYRWATVRPDQLPIVAENLVARNVAVIFSGGNDLATRAAMAVTQTIPIVFTSAGDPVKLGFVTSLNRPGGNVTGITTFVRELLPKRLELLHELLPTASRVALLFNPNSPATSQAEIESAQLAARRLGLEIIIISAGSESEVERAVATAAQQHVSALLITSDALLSSRREYIAALGLRHAVPTISNDRVAVVMGQLMSYASNSDELYRQAGTYVGRILKGEKPADLPVQAPTKYELVINLKTAKALGIEVPWFLQQRADEVIE
jgi:putative tryptophan/tyrosine transport system substrate-binding protein